MALYDDLVGQDATVAQLRAAARSPVHAYLFVGPAGTGTREAARSFAASLLCDEGGCGRCATCLRVRAGTHPDAVYYEREGARISVDDARALSRLGSLSPSEARRRVIVVPELQLAAPVAPALLKTVEEPPASTVFVLLADDVPPDLVTVASRCVRIDFREVPDAVLAAALEDEGVAGDVARAAAAAAGGRIDRARLLASDPGFVARQAAWERTPELLDGTGATAARLAGELLAAVGSIVEPLHARHAAELAELDERARVYGERGLRRKEVQERHRREQRRVRTDELRSGLATLARVYRRRLAEEPAAPAVAEALRALRAIAAANEALVRNPNEVLLLQALLVRLGTDD